MNIKLLFALASVLLCSVHADESPTRDWRRAACMPGANPNCNKECEGTFGKNEGFCVGPDRDCVCGEHIAVCSEYRNDTVVACNEFCTKNHSDDGKCIDLKCHCKQSGDYEVPKKVKITADQLKRILYTNNRG